MKGGKSAARVRATEGAFMNDPYNLQRFVDAQAPVYADVCAELKSGRKRSHWMWYVFPQFRGLGSSPMAQHYAIGSLAEAEAYLAHPVLGARLRDCTRLVNAVQGASIEDIFGYPDDLKFHSSMTLFMRAASTPGGDHDVFFEALRKYFTGQNDAETLRLL
jgi:uncharacterized protein (DUF1810 family)